MFSQKAARWRTVEFLFRKNLPDAILIFGRHFGFIFNLLFFPKNMSIKIILTEWKNIYSLIFAKFLKIKSQKSAILDCAVEKRSSTKCNHYFALQNLKEIFEKYVFLNF
jgi:uncharacterized membrane protein YgaE (UPF0421/DUF939 family)